ncbi:MAG: transposase [Oligoflexales bacterium]|nr:transposase [Oligoflexales bacterium]
MCFYKKRGNAENFIRELKNGFDIQHFPCLKLNANKAYGLLAAFAYNLMRFSSWTLGCKTPRFSNKVWLWLAVFQNCHRSLTTEYHTNFAMAPNRRSGTRMSKFWT